LQDNDVPLEAIQTFTGVRPKEVSRVTSQLLFPVNVKGDRQYYFNNIHEADILEREVRGRAVGFKKHLGCSSY
jgi:hypothetical protein